MMPRENTVRSGRIRIGLYMFTPIIGGAEMYFKNLLWGLDRGIFDVTLFFEPWPEFERFLDLDHCPPTRICRIPVREAGGHYGKPAAGATGGESLRSRLRRSGNSGALRIAGAAARIVRRFALMPYNFRLLYRAFSAHPVDLLHAVNGGYPGAQSAQLSPIAAKLAGCSRCVMSVCNTPMPIRFPRALERALDRCVSRSLDKVLAPTENLGLQVLERGGFPADKLAIVPYGVVDAAHEPEFGVDLPETVPHIGTCRIAMVASFLRHKGHRYLIDAFGSLLNEFPNAHLVLAGDGPERRAVEELVRESGQNGRVSFTGFIPLDQTLRLLATSDIVVHPSDLEGVPYVILHSMSLGKPLLATRVGGIPEVVVDGESGLLIDPSAVDQLTNGLRRLLRDSHLRAQLGLNARARYEKLYTLKAMIQNHQNLFGSLCGR